MKKEIILTSNVIKEASRFIVNAQDKAILVLTDFNLDRKSIDFEELKTTINNEVSKLSNGVAPNLHIINVPCDSSGSFYATLQKLLKVRGTDTLLVLGNLKTLNGVLKIGENLGTDLHFITESKLDQFTIEQSNIL